MNILCKFGIHTWVFKRKWDGLMSEGKWQWSRCVKCYKKGLVRRYPESEVLAHLKSAGKRSLRESDK